MPAPVPFDTATDADARTQPPSAALDAITLSLVVAVALNGVIGANGGLPWRVRADLRRFRKITLGKPVIMGRATFESIGKPLDGRDNIVLTRSPHFAPEGTLVAGSLDEALAVARVKAAERDAGEICVIGGAVVFGETLPLADRLHWTEIAATPGGDVSFPVFAQEDWTAGLREPLPFSEGDTASAVYSLRERRR